MARLNRFLLNTLLFLLPLFVLTTNIQTKPIVLIYFQAKYFLWAFFLSGILFLWAFCKKDIYWTPSHQILLIFGGWLLLSFSWSLNKYQSLESFFHWTLIIISIFLCSHLFEKEKHVQKAFWVTIVSVSLVLILSCLQQFFDIGVFKHTWGFKHASTMGNPSFIAHVSMIILPWFIFLLTKSKDLKQKMVMGGLLLFFGLYSLCMLKDVKAVYIVFLFNTLYLLLWFFQKKFFFKKLLFTTIVFISLIIVVGSFWTYQKISPLRTASTIQQRWIMWKNTMESIRDFPLKGTGIGTFPIVYSKYENEEDRKFLPLSNMGQSFFVRFSHNDFLQIAQEVGMIGFVLFCFFIFLIGRLCIFIFPKNEEKYLHLSLILSFLNFSIIALFHFPLHEPVSALLFSFITGLLIRRNTFQASFLSKKNLLFPLGAVIFFLIFCNMRFFLSEWYLEKAYRNAKNKEEIVNYVRKSLFWNSKNWEMLSAVGNYFIQLEDFYRADHFFMKAASLNPFVPHISYNRGLSYYNLGKDKEALYFIDQSLKIAPDFLLSYYIKGLIYYKHQKFNKAFQFFKKAQSVGNSFRDRAHFMASLCLLEMGKPRLAKREIIEAIAMDGSQIEYHQLLNFLDNKFNMKQACQNEYKDMDIVHHFLQLLEDKNPQVQMETMHEFLCSHISWDELLKLYLVKKNSRAEKGDYSLGWRLFYILLEKIPEQMKEEARSLYINEPEFSPLYVLSLQFLSKVSPYDLATPSFPIFTPSNPALKVISYYKLN